MINKQAQHLIQSLDLYIKRYITFRQGTDVGASGAQLAKQTVFQHNLLHDDQGLDEVVMCEGQLNLQTVGVALPSLNQTGIMVEYKLKASAHINNTIRKMQTGIPILVLAGVEEDMAFTYDVCAP